MYWLASSARVANGSSIAASRVIVVIIIEALCQTAACPSMYFFAAYRELVFANMHDKLVDPMP